MEQIFTNNSNQATKFEFAFTHCNLMSNPCTSLYKNEESYIKKQFAAVFKFYFFMLANFILLLLLPREGKEIDERFLQLYRIHLISGLKF